MCRRGSGLRTESGISSSPTSDMSSEDIVAGSLLLAAVLGFKSCRGSGCLLMEAVCIVDAISNGTELAIPAGGGSEYGLGMPIQRVYGIQGVSFRGVD